MIVKGVYIMSRQNLDEVACDLNSIDFEEVKNALRELKKVEKPGSKTLVVRQLHDSIMDAKRNGATNEQIAEVLTKTTHLQFTKTTLQNILSNLNRHSKEKFYEQDHEHTDTYS
jgi:DNA-binding transcriptional regulator YhcF (GntR family)